MDKNRYRDHEILHYFYEHPLEATTSHSLVKNDKYGINHTIAYSQSLLTPEQIKDMHDNWVLLYDPINHSTPIHGLSQKDIKYHSRWDQVVINGKNKLTKRQIYRYYSLPEVKKKIFKQVKDRPIMMRQSLSPQESWIKRNPVIRKNIGDAADPEDLQYYLERRHVEFHPTLDDMTDRLVIDLDPGEDLNLEDAKKVARYLEKFLENQPFISDIEFQYSGNRGFYVWGKMPFKMNINQLREKLKSLLEPIKKMNGVKTTLRKSPGKTTVRLDLSSMKTLGLIKAEGSLDYRTGYISTNVPRTQLDSFDPDVDAKIDVNSLKPAYSYKDNTIV